MGLIKNKLNKLKRNKLFWERFGKKATTITVTTSIAFSTLFGLVGCNNNKTPETDIVTPEVESETQKAEIEALKSAVESLNSIISNMGDENVEIKAQLESIERKMADIENENVNQKDVILELTNMISQLQTEIESFKEDLKELEETKPSTPSEDEIEVLTNELAKAKMMIAIFDAFENNYIHVDCDEKIDVERAPNGDYAASRGEYDDYGYYNKADNITFLSNYGEETFTISSDEDLKDMFISYFEDDSLVFDKTQSENNKYVFVDKEGYSITVNFENNKLKNVVTENEVKFNISSKENFDALLAEAKEHLKTIGVFDSYKKEVAESLNYKYKSVTGSSNKTDEIYSGVFSGKLSALQCDANEGVVYLLQTNEEQYGCGLDKEGNLIEGYIWENSNPHDLTESFKKEVLMPINNEKTYTIEYDAQTNTYILASTSENESGINITTEVTFNDDLSVDVKQTWDHNREDVETEVITYKIEKISKEKFNEIYNKIAAIVENTKQQEDGLTQ